MASVLIVDGDDHARTAAAKTAAAMGHHVVEASTRRGAFAEACASRFDLILIDVDLPDGDGLGVIRDLRNGPAPVTSPVVTMSSEARRDVRRIVGAFGAGAIDHLSKPFSPDEIALVVRLALAHPAELEEQRVRMLETVSTRGSLVPLELEMRARRTAQSGRPLLRLPEELRFDPAEPVDVRTVDVLVVEDDPSTQALIGEIVRLMGHTVVVANDGEEALRKLHRRRFDLILLDLMMPRVSGMEVLRALRATKDRADTPVVVLTGRHDPDGVLELRDAGVLERLPKPFSSDELERAIAQALSGAEQAALRFEHTWRAAELYVDVEELRGHAAGAPAEDLYESLPARRSVRPARG